MTNDPNKLWLANPTGLIPKGSVCPRCARYNARNVCAQVVVIEDGQILMVKRATAPMEGFWALPGGYLDWDESLEECAARELLEETGVVGIKPKLVGVWSDPGRDEDGRQNVGVVYRLEFAGQRSAKDDEASEVEWFSVGSLPSNIAFDHRRIIEEVMVDKL